MANRFARPVGDPFDALGDPHRRQILDLIATEPRSVGAIADEMPISRPAVSRHRSGHRSHLERALDPAIGDTAVSAWGWRRETPIAPERRRLESWMCVVSHSDLWKKLTWT